jgi:hypothetical protein
MTFRPGPRAGPCRVRPDPRSAGVSPDRRRPQARPDGEPPLRPQDTRRCRGLPSRPIPETALRPAHGGTASGPADGSTAFRPIRAGTAVRPTPRGTAVRPTHRRTAVRPAHRGLPSGSADRGAVTVEAALALCSLALVTALAVGAVAAVGASVRCTDSARELARLAARGEPDRGRAVAARLAPSGARIELAVDGDEATAVVTAEPVRALPVHVSGRAVAVLEPAAAAAATTPQDGSAASGDHAVPQPDSTPARVDRTPQDTTGAQP